MHREIKTKKAQAKTPLVALVAHWKSGRKYPKHVIEGETQIEMTQ